MYRGREGACTLSLRLVLADTTHYPLTQYTEPSYKHLQPRTHQHPTALRTSNAHDTTHSMHRRNCSRKHAGGVAPSDWHRACTVGLVVREVAAAVAGEAWQQRWSDRTVVERSAVAVVEEQTAEGVAAEVPGRGRW